MDGGGLRVRKTAWQRGPAAAAQRYVPPCPEAAWKNLQQVMATKTIRADKGGSNGGRKRGRGGPARLCTHVGGLADTGGVRRLGALQQWSASQLGDRNQQ